MPKLIPEKQINHLGPEKGVITKGAFSVEESLESLVISRKWPDSPLLSTVRGLSRVSKLSRISRKWTLLKRSLFQITPFFEPESL